MSPGEPRSSQGTSRTASSRSPSSGTAVPVSAPEHERMPAGARVGRRDDSSLLSRQPSSTRATAARRELGPVREHDHRSVDVVRERVEPASERGPRPASPPIACDEAARNALRQFVSRELELVRALDDDDLVDRSLAQPLEHLREEESLLGRAEARRLARGEDDRGDAAHQLSVTVTLEMTTGCVGRSSGPPRAPIRSTVSRPSVTSPTIAYSAGRPTSAPVTTKNWLPTFLAPRPGSSPSRRLPSRTWSRPAERRSSCSPAHLHQSAWDRLPGSRSRGRCGGRSCRRSSPSRASATSDAAVFGASSVSSPTVNEPQLVSKTRP